MTALKISEYMRSCWKTDTLVAKSYSSMSFCFSR